MELRDYVKRLERLQEADGMIERTAAIKGLQGQLFRSLNGRR